MEGNENRWILKTSLLDYAGILEDQQDLALHMAVISLAGLYPQKPQKNWAPDKFILIFSAIKGGWVINLIGYFV